MLGLEAPAKSLSEWRLRLLDRLSWTVVVVLCVPVGLAFIVTWRAGRPTAGTLFLLGLVLLLIAAMGRRLGYTTRAWIMILSFVFSTQVGISLAGITSGVGALAVLSGALAALLLGLRQVFVVMSLQVASLLGLVWLATRGYIEPAPVELVASHQPEIWPQRIFVLLLLAVVIAAGIHYLLDKLSRSLETSESLVQELRQQITAREAEETARREAEQRLWRVQKHEMVGQLASGLAHEINNILTVIRANTELMRLDLDSVSELPPELEEFPGCVEEIQQAALSASHETRRLLAFGREDVAESEVVELGEALGEVSERLHKLLAENIRLDVCSCEGVSAVDIDRRQFEQVILNLAINARDAMPDGGELKIECSMISHAPPLEALDGTRLDRSVRVSVRDTGCGIPEGQIDRIFEPFYSSKTSHAGSGLGLSFVHSFVERFGGAIFIESQPGEGTTVHLYFPCAEESISAAPPRVEVPHESKELLYGEERILVVDDNREIRLLVRSILQRAGYQVVLASHGGEALELLAEADLPFDLLCTDAVMPGISGRELAARYAEATENARVLICSGYVPSSDLREMLEHRRYAFLRKPFTPQELTRAVREALQAPVAATPAPPAQRVGVTQMGEDQARS